MPSGQMERRCNNGEFFEVANIWRGLDPAEDCNRLIMIMSEFSSDGRKLVPSKTTRGIPPCASYES